MWYPLVQAWISSKQCSGSGSISQRYGSGSGSFYHQAKIVRKNLIPNVLWLLLDFLSLQNDVNVPSKSNKQIFFLFVFEGQWRKSQDPDPNPLVTGMDPRTRIRIDTKMSWIRNTGSKTNTDLTITGTKQLTYYTVPTWKSCCWPHRQRWPACCQMALGPPI